MSILEFVYKMIKVYFINRKGKSVTLANMTCSATADISETTCFGLIA